MATQALIATSSSGQQFLCPLFDPRYARAHRRRFFRDDIPELAYANSLYQPSGRWPCRGWVLVRRGDYNLIPNLYATNFQLQIDDLSGRGPLLFQNLVLVQARCVSTGVAADPDAVYLVELTDRQGVLWNPWARFPTNSQYNVRSPAYPGQFDLASLTGGSPWSWNTFIGNLWNQMGPFLGLYPGLPVTPVDTPEGWVFPGMSAWDALNAALDHLGLTVSVNLLNGTPYGIVQPGAPDAAHALLTQAFGRLLEDDYEWIDSGSGRAPGQVIVYFHRRYEVYGTEETVRNDTLSWATNAVYAVTVPAPAPYANAAGTGHLWSGFTVRFDVDGNPLAADVATAATIAQQEANNYYNRITRGTTGYMRRVYAGALPFHAGSQVDGVRWFQNQQRPGPDGVSRFGWCTSLIRGPQPPWPVLEGY